MGVIWITSYPRSGNTWVRFLLCSYFYDQPKTPDQVNQTIPDLHLYDPREFGASLRPIAESGRLFVKTHFYPNYRLPLKDLTEGYIHISRNIKDVFISAIKYESGKRLEDIPPRELRGYGDDFLASLGALRWHELGYGSAITHGPAWFGSPWPGLHITYEDLREDTEGVLTQVLEFLGADVQPERVNAAIEWCSLDRMHAMEAGGQRFHESQANFINEGAIGSTIPDPYLDAAFDAAFGSREPIGVT